MSTDHTKWPKFNMSTSSYAGSDSGIDRDELYENIEQFRSKSSSPDRFNQHQKVFEARNDMWSNFDLKAEGGNNVFAEGNAKHNKEALETSSSKSSSSDESSMSSKQRKDLLHRDIEKRRRDRINKSLTQLRDLIPSAKGKINEGSSRSEKLQKAKLLELAVDYLQGLKATGKDSVDSGLPDMKQDPIILESAKQVYLSGYKAGLNHVLLEVSSRFQLGQEEIKTIIASLTSVSVKVPEILLVPQKETGDEDRLHSHGDSKSNPRVDIKEDAAASECEPSTAEKPNTKNSTRPTRTSSQTPGGNGDNSLPYDSAINNILYPRHLESSAAKKSHVLLSTYVLDPYTSRYYPTMLPLEDVLLMNPNGCHDTKDKCISKNELFRESRIPKLYKENSISQQHNKRRCSEEVPVIQNTEKRKFVEEEYRNTDFSGGYRREYRNTHLCEPKPVPGVPSKFELYYMDQMLNQRLPETMHGSVS